MIELMDTRWIQGFILDTPLFLVLRQKCSHRVRKILTLSNANCRSTSKG